MRRILSVLFFLMIISSVFAQFSGMWTNIRNSAYTQDDTIYIRCETANNMVNTQMYYSTQNGWESNDLQLISGVTYQAGAYFDNTSFICVRYRSMVDTFVVMQAPYIIDDIPTPDYNKLGFVVDDVQGDNIAGVDYLDIKNTAFGVSESRFYAGMENFVNEYPVNNGGYVPTEFYIYVGGIVNPETAWQDSIMYAMVFANVPMMAESGLYKIHGSQFSSDSIERIGDISYDNNGIGLVMSCNIEDLINDPDFGDWPNISNSLVYNFFTIKAGITGTVTISDYVKTSQQFFEHYCIEPYQNHFPQISQATALTGVTNTNIDATYIDEDNNFPLIAKVVVHHANGENDTSYDLMSSGFDYENGVNFVAQIPETEWDYMVVKFSDNNVDFTEQTIYPQSSDNDVIQPDKKIYVYPNPFISLSKNAVVKFNYSTAMYKNPILKVYNLRGEEIAKISDSGNGNIFWYPKKSLTSGIYLYKLVDEKNTYSGKITIVK